MLVFENESALEKHIRELIVIHILPQDKDLVLFDSKKSVDILICRNGKRPGLFFLEIKYHKKSHGRLSTGHGKGGGFQPEILSKLPSYFETNMRWILCSENSASYHFLKNSQLKNFIAGGTIGNKHNNIQSKLFKEVGFNEMELITKLKEWIND